MRGQSQPSVTGMRFLPQFRGPPSNTPAAGVPQAVQAPFPSSLQWENRHARDGSACAE